MQNPDLALFIVVDSDARNVTVFRRELNELLNQCNPKPDAHFIVATEEMEAWLLGDCAAIEAAYPKYDRKAYKLYVQDSVCETWEKLAEILKEKHIKKADFYTVGMYKSMWASKIGAYMDISQNKSPSFNAFVSELTKVAD